MKIINKLSLVALCLFLTTAYADTDRIYAPSRLVCNPDEVGSCKCRQNESSYFPEEVWGGFICKGSRNIILKLNYVTMSDSHEAAKAIASYDRRRIINLYSNVKVYHGSSPFWHRPPAASWICGDLSCDLKSSHYV